MTEGSRQLKNETEAPCRLTAGKRELSSFRLRGAYEHDGGPGGQTMLQDPGDETARQFQAEIEGAGWFQAELH